MAVFEVRPINDADNEWVARLLAESWGSTMMVSRGRLFDVSENPGFAAIKDGRPAGLVTCQVEGDHCEVTSLDSLVEGIGIGSALLDAVKEKAVAEGCRRLWLITTNDNTHALHFYQRRGFTLAALYPNALAESRKLKPQISLIGIDGIPLRDEIELEMLLQ